MGSYSREKINEDCAKAIKNPETFYKQGFINYRGRATDNSLYTEIVAEFLLKENNFKKIDEIQPYSRTEAGKKYNMNHKGNYPVIANHNSEKIIAIDLFNQSAKQGSFDYIGKIIDYQTPLKTKLTDSYGEIDLLSANDKEGVIHLLELKKKNAKAPETLLRCVLEAFTYYKIVDRDGLCNEFGRKGYDIKLSPLVFAGDEQYKEWVDMNEGHRPYLKALMEKLEAVPFFLKPSDTKYEYIVTNK